ncbi:pyridoxamine 5'-phosphate oxidase family protein [Chloroflexales bacterium ZM16-3]|nr:pyridoxamine 5'-phosphate oxidase family protein [Chloroflexales bacterium ZM16-3]
MPNDYAARPRAEVKRKDRAVEDDAWIAEMLTRAPIGYLATVADGQPFINSNLFVYDPTRAAIYMHTARYGRTRANIEAAQPVCLSVSEMGRLLPADTALEFSVEYSGVTVFGSARVIEDQEEATYGLQILLDKYFPHLRPGENYQPIMAEELARTSVYRIDIEEWSGKRKAVAEEFPGAFHYPYAG